MMRLMTGIILSVTGVHVKALMLVACGLIDIGIMVVTWKSGAPYGWIVFEGILSLFAAAGLAGD